MGLINQWRKIRKHLMVAEQCIESKQWAHPYMLDYRAYLKVNELGLAWECLLGMLEEKHIQLEHKRDFLEVMKAAAVEMGSKTHLEYLLSFNQD